MQLQIGHTIGYTPHGADTAYADIIGHAVDGRDLPEAKGERYTVVFVDDRFARIASHVLTPKGQVAGVRQEVVHRDINEYYLVQQGATLRPVELESNYNAFLGACDAATREELQKPISSEEKDKAVMAKKSKNSKASKAAAKVTKPKAAKAAKTGASSGVTAMCQCHKFWS